MAVSTASMWRRRESDCVHSQRRSQACSRENSCAMAVTLAQRGAPVAPATQPPDGAATLTGDRPTITTAGSIKLEKFVIEGGVPLSGTITAAGNKNGALPILAACLLTDDEVILRNVPAISDVEAMALLIESLGARVTWLGPGEVKIDASTVNRQDVDRGLAERIRASFLLAGPLLARFGRAHMPPPGGDVIGRRRLDPHLDAFRALGATVESEATDMILTAPSLGLKP